MPCILLSCSETHLPQCHVQALLLLSIDQPAGSSPQQLYDEAMAHFELWLLQQLVQQQVTPASADAGLVTTCMQLLQAVATKAGHQHLSGALDVTALEAAITAMRGHLEAAVAGRALLAASTHQLPPEQLQEAAADSHWQLPVGVLPAVVQPAEEAGGMATARQRATQNLGTLSIIKPAEQVQLQETLSTLLSQLQGACKLDAAAAGTALQLQQVLRAVERELFGLACGGFDQPSCALTTDEAHTQLEAVVDAYREVSEKLRGSKAGAALLQVELHSRQVLVAWVAYCILFRATRGHQVLRQYGVALRWQDLQHLVLSDRQAVDTALAVAAYLQQQHKPGKEMFSMRDQGKATCEMAQQYAAADGLLQLLLAQEQKAAAERVDAHWRKVVEKQAEAQAVRVQLEAAREEHRRLCEAWQAAPHGNSRREQSQKDVARNKVIGLERQVAFAEAPPPPVIQPLPAAVAAAGQWLFFLHMPRQLRVLSRATFLAQQLLLPRPLGAAALQLVAISKLACKTSIVRCYNSMQHGTYTVRSTRSGSDGAVSLHSPDQLPEEQAIQLQHIDQYTDAKHGVWHPDGWQLQLGWKGSGAKADGAWQLPGDCINPFTEVPAELLEGTFTEQLPEKYKQLQWALWQPGAMEQVDPKRSNQGIATRCDKPGWLNDPAWLSFTSLRAYPLQQLQKLCGALREQQLPWGHPAVRALVQMTVYQLGQLVDSHPAAVGGARCTPRQLGRTDWEQPGRELLTLVSELAALAEQLQEAPREHDAVLLLGELAAYLSDWSGDACQVARRFAAMTAVAADALQPEIDAVLDQEGVAAQLKGKQCKSRMLALLCYGAGPLGEEEVQQLLTLLVQIKHADLYMPDADLSAELSQLRVRCQAATARQLPRIQQLLDQPAVRDRVLTAAAASVTTRAPVQLHWHQLQSASGESRLMTGSYEATGIVQGTQHLYSINVLDGTVLLDGLPLGRLPSNILRHPLYQRSFGSSNFEVQRTAAGVMQTVQPIDGKLYDFYLTSCGQLLVEEVDWATGGRLQLLDPGQECCCAGWGEQLPVRLRTMHSHWLDR
jgi:transposase-like protein